MATLYELTDNFQKVYEMEDLDEQTWTDTLESIECGIEDKADGYAKVIRSLESDAEAFKQEAARFTEKKRLAENKIKRLKETLQDAMVTTGKKKFQTELFKFNIQNNPPSVKILDEENFIKNEDMENYIIYQTPTIDKKQLLSDLKAGVEIDGVELQQSESLRFK